MRVKIIKASDLGPDLNLSPRYHLSPKLTEHNGEVRTVKNLGWLLRNWRWVERFHVTRFPNGEGLLQADLLHPRYRQYATDFASYDVLINFLDRPVFRGLEIDRLEDGFFLRGLPNK